MAWLKIPLVIRFWNKVDKTPGYGPDGDCWVWRASKDADGYGYLSRPLKRAHRASWEIHNGTISVGLCVLHRCDNPPCVNPAHLFLGTRADNNRDKARKGRSHHIAVSAILTESQVKEIRARYSPAHTSYRRLGAEYGVSKSAINHIVHRRTWRHVS